MGTRVYDSVTVAAMRAMTVTHRVVDKVTGGRLGRQLAGTPVLWLTVKGRRSGREQRVPLATERDGSDPQAPFLVAGSRGGTEKTPVWALNLRGHAERGDAAWVQVGNEHIEVDVTELRGLERDRGYALMIDAYRGFAEYQKQTDRVIPVFSLRPCRGSDARA